MQDIQELKRLDNESEEEYQIRVSSLKDKYGLTWEQIAKLLNEELGYMYTESRYRKQYNAYLKGYYDASIKTSTTESSEDSENLLRSKYMESTAKIPYYREIRQDSRFERFYRLIAENIKKIEPPQFRGEFNQNEDTQKEYLCTLADLHIGAKFEGVNNNYSVEIAAQRFEKLKNYLCNFIIEHNIQKIKILSLGDIIQGILRISDLKLNEMPVVESFIYAARMIADFLNELSQYAYVEFLQVCFSNHDQIRPLGTKASELASEDLGKILFSYLSDVLSRNSRVLILGEPNLDYLKFNIFNFNCIALHGHQINNLNSLSKDLANRHREFFDYVFVGHSHSAKEIINAEGDSYNVETLVAPSFVGSCPYADKLMVGSKAGSKIFEFDEKYGHIASYNIILN